MTQEKRRQLGEERLSHQVEIQSRQIERVFSQHQVAARVENGTVRRHAIQFNLQTQLSAGLERLRAMTEDLVSALRVTDVRLQRVEGRWQLQVARPEEPAVALLDLLTLLDDVPLATAVLGLTEFGAPMLAALHTDEAAHMLIAGDRGAGKTVLLRSIATSLALGNPQRDLQLLVLSGAEGHGRELLLPLSYLPHMLADVITTPEEAEMVLMFLADEIAYRQEQRISEPRIVVLIDQIVALFEQVDEQARTAVQRVAQRGASVGVHLIISTQRPTHTLLDAALRLCLPMRVVGQTMDGRAARVAADGVDVQAGYLLGEGDFVACIGSQTAHFQAAYIGDYDLHLALGKLRRKRYVLLARPFNPRLQLAPVTPDSEDEVLPAVEPASPEPALWPATLSKPAPETPRKAGQDAAPTPAQPAAASEPVRPADTRKPTGRSYRSESRSPEPDDADDLIPFE